MINNSQALAAPGDDQSGPRIFEALTSALFGNRKPDASPPERKAPKANHPAHPASGVARIRGAQLLETASESAMLTSLRRAGLRLVRLDRFSSERRSLASQIGNNIRFLNGYLRTLRYALAQTNGKLKYWLPKRGKGPLTAADWKEREQVQRALRPLVAAGVFADDPGFGKSKSAKSSTAKPFWEHRVANNDVARFVHGDWLACYAEHILHDQLEREQLNHETFCQLTVDVPQDMIAAMTDARSRVEFDVLSMIQVHGGRNRLLWIECKSGSVENVSANQTVGAKKVIENVLRSMGNLDAELHVMCLVLPLPGKSKKQQTRLKALETEYADAGISLVMVDQLRPWVAQNIH